MEQRWTANGIMGLMIFFALPSQKIQNPSFFKEIPLNIQIFSNKTYFFLKKIVLFY